MRDTGQASLLRRDLRASVADGAAFSVMVGLGETYLPAFVLAVGLGAVVAGLTTTVPLLAGAVLQLISPLAVRRLRSHRRWVILCAASQALAFTPLVYAALAGRISAFGVLAIATLYWSTGMAAGPAWNTWMACVVPHSLRAQFFASRTRLTQAAALIGLLAGGIGLQVASGQGATLHGFALLFAAACGFRLISTGFLARQHEPGTANLLNKVIPPREVLSRLRDRPHGPLFVYMLTVQAATYLAAPYFTPYMLQSLRLSYGQYMLLLATAFAAKIVALPAIGRFAQRFGARKLLWLGGLGIVPLPALWLVSSAVGYLLPIQVLAGAAWACYELATFLLLFETIPLEERTSILTAFNLTNAAALVVGSLLGGAILRLMGESHFAYLFLFAVSSCCRLITVPSLRRIVGIPPVPARIGVRTLAVRPSAGSLDGPVLPSIAHPDNSPDTET